MRAVQYNRLRSFKPTKRVRRSENPSVPSITNYQSEELRKQTGYILPRELTDRDYMIREEEARNQALIAAVEEKKRKKQEEEDALLGQIGSSLTNLLDITQKPSNDSSPPKRVELTPELQKAKEQEEAIRLLEEQSKKLKIT